MDRIFWLLRSDLLSSIVNGFTAGVTILHGSDLLAASNALQFVDDEG